MKSRLVGVAEIAELLGVSRQRVWQLVESYPDFPEPEAQLAAGRIWARSAIETWMLAHPQRASGRGERKMITEEDVALDRWTDQAREILKLGLREAVGLNHNYLGCEHLLLGLLALGEGNAFEVLDGLGLTLEEARGHVERVVGVGKAGGGGVGTPGFTPRAATVLKLSMSEALKSGANVVAPEHVLLAMLREGSNVACRVLKDARVEADDVAAAIRSRSSSAVSPAGARATADVHSSASASTAAAPAAPAAEVAESLERIAASLERLDARLGAIESRLGNGT